MQTAAKADDAMVSMTGAAERIGVSAPTLRKAIRKLGVPTFVSPVNARTRLVRVKDVDRLLLPIVETNRPRKGAAAK
jgi:hypothetical protein